VKDKYDLLRPLRSYWMHKKNDDFTVPAFRGELSHFHLALNLTEEEKEKIYNDPPYASTLWLERYQPNSILGRTYKKVIRIVKPIKAFLMH